MEDQVDLLVFSPHYGDEIIMCGATISKHVREKKSVVVVYVGALGEDDAKKAHTISVALGFKYDELVVNGRIDRGLLVEKILQYKPRKIITTHPGDWDSEHRDLSQMVKEAVYWARREAQRRRVSLNHPILLYGTNADIPMCFVPNCFCNVSLDDIQKKLNCTREYDWTPKAAPNKIRDVAHDLMWIPRQADEFGELVGCKLAELFELGNAEPVLQVG